MKKFLTRFEKRYLLTFDKLSNDLFKERVSCERLVINTSNINEEICDFNNKFNFYRIDRVTVNEIFSKKQSLIRQYISQCNGEVLFSCDRMIQGIYFTVAPVKDTTPKYSEFIKLKKLYRAVKYVLGPEHSHPLYNYHFNIEQVTDKNFIASSEITIRHPNKETSVIKETYLIEEVYDFESK